MKYLPKHWLLKCIYLLIIGCNSYYCQVSLQKIDKEKYTVYIEESDIRIKASILAHKEKITTKKDRFYYWYSTNKIMETEGGNDGKLLHGEYTSFYQNTNNLKEKGKFKKGLKNGKWIGWNEDGKIKTSSNWKQGKLHGYYKTYNTDGAISSVKKYKNGKELEQNGKFKRIFNKENFRFKRKKKAILTT